MNLISIRQWKVEGSQLQPPSHRTIRERLLLFLSRDPETDDYGDGRDKWTPGNALSQLCRSFPDFLARIADKEILDFGCGTGRQSVALAQIGAKRVVGIDTNAKCLHEARELAGTSGLVEKVEFIERLGSEFEHRFDVVISQNSMEHFPDPGGALSVMTTALNDDGVILITFGPPWLAPSGSHMHFFVRFPWVNILFDEKTVMNVRREFRNDGAARYTDVEGGLNKMTVSKFERLMSECHLRAQYQRYDCVKSLDFLGRLPLIRELFINQISCVLTK